MFNAKIKYFLSEVTNRVPTRLTTLFFFKKKKQLSEANTRFHIQIESLDQQQQHVTYMMLWLNMLLMVP